MSEGMCFLTFMSVAFMIIQIIAYIICLCDMTFDTRKEAIIWGILCVIPFGATLYLIGLMIVALFKRIRGVWYSLPEK
jgi:hypothetical protein